MFRKVISAAFLVAFAFTFSVNAQELPEDLKCVMAGKPAKAEASVDYRGGKVYLCCNQCVAGFTKDSSKFTTLANHQLLLTGQFEQTGCPISGGDVDKEQFCEVGGVKVFMCCGKCKAKVDAATDEEKIELVFANDAFDKGFAMKKQWDITGVKCFMMPKRDVNEAKFVDHREGKVFFCCPNCVKKWNADPAKYEQMANFQLFQTGQFKQTACPISGGDIDEEQFSEVGGKKVYFCCENCKAKVDAASTEEAKQALVFGKKMFEKGFAKK